MTSFRQLTTTLGGVVACAALSFAAAIAETPESGDPVRGKQLYYDHGCYGCHGFNGETGVRRLVGTDSPILETPEMFIAYLRLRADYAPILPSTGMPHYSESVLSNTDALHIYAYVRTFKLNAPDAESLPALKAIVDSARAPYKAPSLR